MSKSSDTEVWKNVIYLPPDIQISNQGQVRRFVTMEDYEIVKLATSSNYKFLNIRGQSYAVHRLVAELFVHNPDPEIYTIVKFKNGNRSDCKAENLEWVTTSKKSKESFTSGSDVRRKIFCPELDQVFGSVRSAACITGVPQELISKCIQKGMKMCGLTFQMIEADSPLLDDHNIFYIDLDSAVELAHESKSVADFQTKVMELVGEGIKRVKKVEVVEKNE